MVSRNRTDQASLATHLNELQRIVDGFGAMLSALADSLRDNRKAMAAQVADLVQGAAEFDGEARRHLTESQARMNDLVVSVERSAATAAEELATLRQEIFTNLSTESATASAEAMGRLERSVQALDSKGDAAIEATLLTAAAQEADLAQLRRELAGLVERRVAAHVEIAIAGKLEQLRTEIARSIGRQIGDLRLDLDVLLGKSNLDFVDALALLGVDPSASPLLKQLDDMAACDDLPAPAHPAAGGAPAEDEKQS